MKFENKRDIHDQASAAAAWHLEHGPNTIYLYPEPKKMSQSVQMVFELAFLSLLIGKSASWSDTYSFSYRDTLKQTYHKLLAKVEEKGYSIVRWSPEVEQVE